MPGDAIQPGDVILVHRRINARAWVRDPLSTLISWRIQRTTNSDWNHAAGVVKVSDASKWCHPGAFFVLAPGLSWKQTTHIVEAEWNKGVVTSILEDAYPGDKYIIGVAKPPENVDREAVVAFWQTVAKSKTATYDWRSIAMMRFAALIGGHEGIRKYVHNGEHDDLWICSELAAAGWQQGGFTAATRALTTPADFAEFLA